MLVVLGFSPQACIPHRSRRYRSLVQRVSNAMEIWIAFLQDIDKSDVTQVVVILKEGLKQAIASSKPR